MRKILRTLLLGGALAGGATPALADGLAVGAGIGTLGFEGHLATEVNSFLALRLNANYADFTVPDIGVYGTDFGGISYDVTGDYLTVGILADFHPLGLSPVGSGFVVTGGVYYNRNEFTATTGPVTVAVGGQPPQSVDLVGNFTFPDYAPYVGLGYDGTFHGLLPVSFYARAGVLFQGSASVTLREISGNPGITQADLDAEAQQIQDDLSNYEYYPVFSVGMTISF